MARLFEQMLARTGKKAADFRSNSKLGKITRKLGVPDTEELQRVVNLPRRKWQDNPELPFLIQSMTDWLKVPGGQQTLRPLQAAALADLHDYRGFFGPVGLGDGKTHLTRLAPLVVEAKRPLLIIPADLKPKTEWEFEVLDAHWRRHPNLEIVTYTALGLEQNEDFFETYEPDFIECDEVHFFRNLDAARTRRLARYLLAHPETVFMGLSGTITKRSIKDFFHLLFWALGPKHMPLPGDRQEAVSWSLALDAKVPMNQRMQPGALKVFVPQTTLPTLKQLRKGFSKRIMETPGVVGSESSQGIDASIVLDFWDPELAPKIRSAIARVAKARKSLNGDYLLEPGDIWSHVRELVCGFYYKWVEQPPVKWLKARTAWHSFVRGILDQHRGKGLDSPLQVRNACEAGKLDSYNAFEAWEAIEHTFKLRTKPVWLDDGVMEQIAEKADDGVLIWVEHRAVGQKLAEMTGLPYFHKKGIYNGVLLESLEGKPAILSIRSNRQGRNLQYHWHTNVVVTPPPADDFHQLIGRTHRPGQEVDPVRVSVMLGHRILDASMSNAFEEAEYQQEIQGTPHKLLLADATRNLNQPQT